MKDRNVQTRIAQKLIELYKASGELGVLHEEYEAWLAENPGDTAHTYLVALMRIENGDIEGAEPLVNQLLNDVSVTNREWFNTLARTYRLAGDLGREIYVLDRAIQKLSSQDMYRKFRNVRNARRSLWRPRESGKRRRIVLGKWEVCA